MITKTTSSAEGLAQLRCSGQVLGRAEGLECKGKSTKAKVRKVLAALMVLLVTQKSNCTKIASHGAMRGCKSW